ncbi:hypothetical protein CIW48_26985 [Methylobacterium sp. P1-11]|uniref:HNH endonuclease n=1 Tax=Methylobacterium sp. P1-11 TaxID=2024616 RepID=UPI0011ED8ABF|nr:HNH endonuclease [Methylobacterium sp. P1-11]KAA0117852.1 hypothetical protein CIW48_26985 [Methylobacterium sp. P1-11]
MSVRLKLSDGTFATIDECDEAAVSHIVWRREAIKRASGGFYIYGRCPVKRDKVYLHRFLLNAKRGEYVDHVNGDGTDNRRSNIRLCSPSENNANRAAKPNKWGFRGVFWCNEHRKFRGRVMFEGRTYQTAWFPAAAEAAKARDRLASDIHRQFAVLNFREKRA